MVLTKTEAEARRTCSQGVAAYISERHKAHLNKSIAYGVIGGIIPTGILFISSNFMTMNRWLSLVPLGIGLVSGWGYGVWTSDSNDAQHQVDFETVCAQFEEEDDEAEEDESDGSVVGDEQ
tara:strand:- start:515 stop:877 length:363 start_codon:yes stop_codon:yes gene_type:complete